jgi:hypothetical protein
MPAEDRKDAAIKSQTLARQTQHVTSLDALKKLHAQEMAKFTAESTNATTKSARVF